MTQIADQLNPSFGIPKNEHMIFMISGLCSFIPRMFQLYSLIHAYVSCIHPCICRLFPCLCTVELISLFMQMHSANGMQSKVL